MLIVYIWFVGSTVIQQMLMDIPQATTRKWTILIDKHFAFKTFVFFLLMEQFYIVVLLF